MTNPFESFVEDMPESADELYQIRLKQICDQVRLAQDEIIASGEDEAAISQLVRECAIISVEDSFAAAAIGLTQIGADGMLLAAAVDNESFNDNKAFHNWVDECHKIDRMFVVSSSQLRAGLLGAALAGILAYVRASQELNER